jgi:hypothetical protein
VEDSLGSEQQSLINCLTRPVEIPASAPPPDSVKWRNTFVRCSKEPHLPVDPGILVTTPPSSNFQMGVFLLGLSANNATSAVGRCEY